MSERDVILKRKVTLEYFKSHLEVRGYELIEIKHWKNHDTVIFASPPKITRATYTLRCHVTELSLGAVHKLWPWRRWP